MSAAVSAPASTHADAPKALSDETQSGRPAEIRNATACYILAAVVALAPLPFGANDPVSVALLCLTLAAGLWRASTARIGRPRGLMLLWISGVALAHGAVVCGQLLSNPWFARPDPIWLDAGAALGTSLPATLSVMRAQPLFALGPSLACLGALSLGVVVGADRRAARVVVQIFAWSGAGYAAYGTIAAFVSPGMILWLERPGYVGNVVGTFVNRNTAATYFGCAATCWLLLLAETVRARLPRRPLTYGTFSKRVLRQPGWRLMTYFVVFAVCLIALLMTASRAGVLLSLATMLSAAAIAMRTVLPKRFGWAYAIAGGLVAATAILQLFGGATNSRFETSGFSDEGRLDIYRAILAMIEQHPWFGSGLGTFAYSFPRFRAIPPDMTGIWTMGHSTPLETAAELGLPLTMLFGLTVAAGLTLLLGGALRRRRDDIIPLLGAAVIAIAVLHSTIDFSLQIPGFAIVAMAITGIGLAQSVSSLPRPEDATPDPAWPQ